MHEPTGCCHAPVMVQARWDTPPRPGAHVPVATEPAAVVGHEAAAVAIAWQKISKRDAPPPPPPPWSARTHATTRYTGARTGARGGGRDIDPHAGEAAVTLRRAGPPGVAHAGHQRVARQGRGIGRLVDSDVGTRVPCTRHHAPATTHVHVLSGAQTRTRKVNAWHVRWHCTVGVCQPLLVHRRVGVPNQPATQVPVVAALTTPTAQSALLSLDSSGHVSAAYTPQRA
jgi:hypothetical protein